MCFNETTQKRLMVDENMQLINQVLETAIEQKKRDLILLSFRLLTFFSKYASVQAYIVTLNTVKTLFNSMKDASGLDRKFLLSILLDIVQNVRTHQIIKSLSWSQGIEVLLQACFENEPMAVGKIFAVLMSDT